jgi:protein involved in polysaccharide export with SLBB domain
LIAGTPALVALFLLSGAEAPFEVSTERFADAAACEARLASLAGEARAGDYDAVEGPYRLGPGDIRIHMVRAEGSGHRIDEHRCLGSELSARSWRHSMEAAEAEEEAPFTIESVARSAPWLKRASGGRLEN